MKYRFLNLAQLIFFLISTSGFTVFCQQPNGGIVTLSGDTIPCTIASSPKEVDLRKQAGAYRYDYLVAVFTNDSVRILYPGSIKAFYVKRNEENNIKTSWYVSDSINSRFDVMIKRPILMRPVFLQRLVSGGHYHLWYFEQADPGSRNDRCFVLEESSSARRFHFNTTKRLRKLLGDWPGSQKQDPRYKDWYTGKQWMVLDYNMFKAGK
jgi:hypothetical protein